MNAIVQQSAGEIMEQVIVRGDLSKLSPIERATYYTQLCNSLGLNALTQPFSYITLNGKLTLYALKGATDQLRKVYGVSLEKPTIDYQEDLVIVTITGRDKENRTDCDIGAVVIGHLKGEARANAIMKAITKAKRRLTLSLCGLGMLDETEVETIPNAVPFVEAESVPMQQLPAPQQAPTAAASVMSNATWERLNTLAIKRYNGEWDSKKAGFAIFVSDHRVNDVMALTEVEALNAIDRLEEKLADMKAAAEAVPQPA